MKSYRGLITMELSTEMADLIKDLFDLELEMLEGTVENLPNNMKRIVIQLPENKSQQIKEFFMKSIANTHQICLN